MKLINDFFTVTEIDDSQEDLKFKVRMNPAHPIYQVHFPGNPITPGVCLVQMAEEILENRYQRRLLLQTAVNIKFKMPIGPEDSPWFVFNKVEFSEEVLSVRISIEADGKQYAKMSLRYNIAE